MISNLSSSRIPSIYNYTNGVHTLKTYNKEQIKKSYYMALTGGISGVIGVSSLFLLMRSGRGGKILNNISAWSNSSQNLIAKLFRKLRSLNKINIEIKDKAFTHFSTKTQNIKGITNKGVQGAHEMREFLKAFIPKMSDAQIVDISRHSELNQFFHIKYTKDGVTSEKLVYIGDELGQDYLSKFKALCSPECKKQNKKLFKNIMNNHTQTKETTIPPQAANMSDFIDKISKPSPNGKIVEIIQDPFNDGIWDIVYSRKGFDDKFHKTVYLNAPLDEESKKIFEEIYEEGQNKIYTVEELIEKFLPKNQSSTTTFESKLLSYKKLTDKVSPKENILSGNFICSDEQMREMAQRAFEKGIIIPTKDGSQQQIIGKENGILFMAYGSFDKATKTFVIDNSFFPLNHGNEKHKELIKSYIERCETLDFLNIPLFLGFNENIFTHNFVKNTILKMYRDMSAVGVTIGYLLGLKQPTKENKL